MKRIILLLATVALAWSAVAQSADSLAFVSARHRKLKLKGAEKVSLVTDAMRAAGQNVTESYLGKICPEARVIVEDGVAKLPDRTFYAGSIATSEIAFRNAVMNYEIPITDATTMMSAAPAKYLGIGDRKGSIKVGYDADLVITDLSCNVQNVFVGGRQVK